MEISKDLIRQKKLRVCFFYDDCSWFEDIKSRLRSKFDLVPAIPPEDKPEFDSDRKNYLVCTDGNGNGIYRINFIAERKVILFKYWTHRLTPEILEKNPMLGPLREVYEMAKPKHISDYREKLEFP
ncbi:MAG TPA: hypothetical protein VJ485_01150 [archaeon]|jgi:hypothetical protein|nr:hypothetical protein [archaeon]